MVYRQSKQQLCAVIFQFSKTGGIPCYGMLKIKTERPPFWGCGMTCSFVPLHQNLGLLTRAFITKCSKAQHNHKRNIRALSPLWISLGRFSFRNHVSASVLTMPWTLSYWINLPSASAKKKTPLSWEPGKYTLDSLFQWTSTLLWNANYTIKLSLGVRIGLAEMYSDLVPVSLKCGTGYVNEDLLWQLVKKLSKSNILDLEKLK